MQVQSKWHLRQYTLEVLSYLLCFTAVIAGMLVIRGYQFSEYGLEMYKGVRWPAQMTVTDVAAAFWRESALPLLQWVPLALLGDAALRRYVYRLRE